MHRPTTRQQRTPARRTPVLAMLILPLLAVLCAALAAELLADAGHALPRAWAMLRALPAPGAAPARVARHAIEGAALVAVICAALALPVGWALGRLPRGWAAVARALLCYPALTLVLAWLLGFAVLLQASGPVRAALSAGSILPLPAGPRALLIALLLPPLASAAGAAWRRPDPVSLRAAETLGAGPWRVFARLVLPRLLGPLADGTLLAFVAACGVLAMRAVPPAVAVDGRALAALAAVAAAAALVAMLAWRGAFGPGDARRYTRAP